jgi:hypothetical protein
VRQLSSHKLRHTCGSRLANDGGADIFDIQKVLRHANLKYVPVYVHKPDVAAASAINRMAFKETQPASERSKVLTLAPKAGHLAQPSSGDLVETNGRAAVISEGTLAL